MATKDLAEHPLLGMLSSDQLEQLRPCAAEVRYEASQFIFREGDAADTLYLLQRGLVALEQNVPGRGVVQVESLQGGTILGLSWLFPSARWMLDARCVEAVSAVALNAECVRDCMSHDSSLGVEVLSVLSRELYQRLLRVRLQRLDVYKVGP